MKKILFFSFIFLILILFLVQFFWQGIFVPKDSKGAGKEVVFIVKKGENVFEIGEKLEKEGLIENKIFFDFYILLQRKEKDLKAGKYLLSSEMSVSQIAQKIIEGKIAQMKITIPEGFSVKDIENLLNLDLPDELEGYLFPDTYYFSINPTSEEVVQKMRENFNSKISPYREEIEKSGKTLEEIIIMASLIEKEVFNTKECPNCKNLVSGILWKRIKNKIPLQVDATITYITGKKTTKISLEDTKIDHPYNTYKYLGLPPGPICNPGLESILAALRPEESEYWYYLTTREGKVIFSKTFQEHIFAKAKYLY
ncbi:endolytic transglycosylase MltG [Candidatus Parcubacteria bacterium]|nr:endolytic transglycosylase MltG [Candidatus Parcubacteria bacterium]